MSGEVSAEAREVASKAADVAAAARALSGSAHPGVRVYRSPEGRARALKALRANLQVSMTLLEREMRALEVAEAAEAALAIEEAAG